MVKELESTKDIDARTIQTGFVKYWDDTGGPDAEHYNYQEGGFGWHPEDYKFAIPRESNVANEDVRVGRPLRENTFRMVPTGRMAGTRGSTEANEYVKKMLFTWAINLDPEGMADLFGTTLRQYEKPKSTRSGRGALRTKRRSGTQPLPLDTQKTKFLWARLIHDNEEITKHKDIYGDMYKNDVDNSYRISMNQASRQSMRDLYKELPDVLEVGIGGGEQLSADSPEEIMMAIAGADLSAWNDPNANLDDIVGDMEEILAGMEPRMRESKIDIPPHLTNEIDRITQLLAGQDELISRIEEGGIEITEQHGRLAKMYGSGDVGDGEEFIGHYTQKIKEDIVKQYRRPTPTGKRTIAEQFYDRDVGVGDTNVLTWSEPAWGGVAFFAIYIPSTRPLSEEDVSIISYFLDDTPNLWRGVLRQQGIHNNHALIREAASQVFDGVVKTKTGAVIKTHVLGTTMTNMVGVGKDVISTKVDATAPKEVASALFDLVSDAAVNIGNRLTLSQGAEFTEWVRKQHGRGEKTAWKIHQRKGKGWANWLDKTGGKQTPKPKEAIDWTQPIHPRPFLWMTAVGQAAASQAALAKARDD